MGELWSESEAKDSGFDVFELAENCCFSSCFATLFVTFILSFPIIAVLLVIYWSK